MVAQTEQTWRGSVSPGGTRKSSAAEPQLLQNFIVWNSSRFDEVLAIILELVDRFVDIGERFVLALFDPALGEFRLPALAQLFQRRNIEVAVVEIILELRHPPREKAAVLTDRIAAHRRGFRRHILAHKSPHALRSEERRVGEEGRSRG